MRQLATIAGLVMASTGEGWADMVGVTADLIDTADGLDTYRVYAEFGAPADRLLLIGGDAVFGEFVMAATHDLFNDSGRTALSTVTSIATAS